MTPYKYLPNENEHECIQNEKYDTSKKQKHGTGVQLPSGPPLWIRALNRDQSTVLKLILGLVTESSGFAPGPFYCDDANYGLNY